MLLSDVEAVEGPGLGDVDDPRVFLPQGLVAPQAGHPDGHQPQSHGEAGEEEEAVAVWNQALLFLVHHRGGHGEEGEDEEDEDLALGDQVPEEGDRG